VTSANVPVVETREVAFHNVEYANWFMTIIACVFRASFSFVGLEVVAAAAQEASFQEDLTNDVFAESQGNELNNVQRDISNSADRLETSTQIDTGGSGNPSANPFSLALYVPWTAAVLYLWGGWSVSQNIDYNDPDLMEQDGSDSIFIITARRHSEGMATALTAFFILGVAFTSSTALYVASRALFGLAYATTKSQEVGHHDIRLPVARFLAKKSKFDVPYIAVFCSASISLLSLLEYAPKLNLLTVSVPMAFVLCFTCADLEIWQTINVVTELGSVCCIFVWCFESLAALRFYIWSDTILSRCTLTCVFAQVNELTQLEMISYKEHILKQTDQVPQEYRSIVQIDDNTWYYSHLILSGLTSLLCLVVAVAGATMVFIHDRTPAQGVASYLIVSSPCIP
jgi:hypothetical protein